ncbi:MAG: D-glycero-beta-D-manno-heptose 1-phosphate adenylyltransferase [Acidobacteriia bacterium]|nr:D-glycero-beta-D-manno-heptose 1-phosphate adenylyltransferase [Terriglobia bacterium]
MSAPKILTLNEFLPERKRLAESGLKLVFTNGCFDLLHPGHVEYLEKARALGDRLIVAINTDESVRSVKGPSRPIIPQEERAEVLAALAAVDYVTFFEEATPQHIIRSILPDILVKGSDWALHDIVGRKEVEAAGGQVVSIDVVPGYSTSAILDTVRSRFGSKK